MSDKGAQFERDVRAWIQVLWPRADRNGKGFAGCDFRETDEYGFEAKNRSRMELSEWMVQTVTNAKNEKRKWPVLVHKRRRYSTSDAYVTMRLEDWFKMQAELRGMDDVVWPNDVSEGEADGPGWD